MTSRMPIDDVPSCAGKASESVHLSISDSVLNDLVELALRLDDVPIQVKPVAETGLLIADSEGHSAVNDLEGPAIPNERILLLVADEVEIPVGAEYLVVPKVGDNYDLDPELLVGKVRSLLEGKRPSAERSPVTGLPGMAAFEAELRGRISTGERFGVVFADLNHFRSFNKAYSYARGDTLLIALAELLDKSLSHHPHPQNFLAHLGSDDFTIITSEKLAPDLAEEIVDAFDEMVASHYDVRDLARGHVVMEDRRGNESQHRIVTIALAVILSSRRGIAHPAEVLDIAEEMLQVLKSRDIQESCCIVERLGK